jgi:hypothetical protein
MPPPSPGSSPEPSTGGGGSGRRVQPGGTHEGLPPGRRSWSGTPRAGGGGRASPNPFRRPPPASAAIRSGGTPNPFRRVARSAAISAPASAGADPFAEEEDPFAEEEEEGGEGAASWPPALPGIGPAPDAAALYSAFEAALQVVMPARYHGCAGNGSSASC